MALITCPECGAQVSDAASNCPQCGCPLTPAAPAPVAPAPVAPAPAAPAPAAPAANAPVCPETHLVKAILVTFFCCLPLGIPAIINAADVDKTFVAGNYALAQEKSDKANKWSNIALIAGLVGGGIYLLLIILLTVFGVIADL